MKGYNYLDPVQQVEIAMMLGVPLQEVKRYNMILRLFQIEGFYIEICTLADSGLVVMVHAFDNTVYLEPYLKDIDISGLLEA